MSVRRRERSLSIKRKKIRDRPLKASHLLVAYLNPTISPCIVLLLFFLLCIVFYIALILYIAIVDDLAPQVDLISSIEMTPLVTYSTPPLIRYLMVSIKVFGKLVVEPKTLGWEHSLERFRKCFRKPWSSHYSTEMFSNCFINMELDMRDKGLGGFMKSGIVYKCSPNQLLPCNHIAPVWDGA
jgi:hypothetical protein